MSPSVLHSSLTALPCNLVFPRLPILTILWAKDSTLFWQTVVSFFLNERTTATELQILYPSFSQFRAHAHTVPASLARSLARSLPPPRSPSSRSLHPCLCLSHSPTIRHSNNIIALTASWGLAEKPSCLKATVTLYPNNTSKGIVDTHTHTDIYTTFKDAKSTHCFNTLPESIISSFSLSIYLNKVKVKRVKVRYHQSYSCTSSQAKHDKLPASIHSTLLFRLEKPLLNTVLDRAKKSII